MNERVECTGLRQPKDRLEMASGNTNFWKEFFQVLRTVGNLTGKSPTVGGKPNSTEKENPAAAAAIRLIGAEKKLERSRDNIVLMHSDLLCVFLTASNLGVCRSNAQANFLCSTFQK